MTVCAMIESAKIFNLVRAYSVINFEDKTVFNMTVTV